MDFLFCKNSQEWLKGYTSLFNWVIKKLSLYDILVEFAIRIWIFALVIINIIIFIITVIIVDVNRLVLSIFTSVRTTTEICARQSRLPALATIVGTPLLHAFAFHEVDDCLRCWGKCGHHWDPCILDFFPFPVKAFRWWQNWIRHYVVVPY